MSQLGFLVAKTLLVLCCDCVATKEARVATKEARVATECGLGEMICVATGFPCRNRDWQRIGSSITTES